MLPPEIKALIDLVTKKTMKELEPNIKAALRIKPNADGTYNGIEVLSALSGLPQEEVKAIAEEVKVRYSSGKESESES